MRSLKQVKLIATDMDGTLLNSQRKLPPDFFYILDELHRQNILFVIASGRSYPTLSAQFNTCRDKLIFMAENGCCVVNNHRLVYMESMTEAQLTHLIGFCSQLPQAYPVLSGYSHAYVFYSTPAAVMNVIDLYYENIRYINNISDIPEPICKITICDITGAEKHSFPLLSQLQPPYRATLSGYMWIDLGLVHTSKGRGLAALQEKYHISPDETMIFGDYLNDYEMMQQGYFSYAMANAHPDLKAVSHFETLSNDEDGVMHIIRQLLTALKE